jgi:broad specificity phosphatase PhoE
MIKIVLIRPGSTDYDQQGRIQGSLSVPLNDEGSAEVARTVEELRELKLDAVYSPGSEPAMQTAAAIADAHGLKVRKLDRMQNLNHGLWQGMRIDEVRRKQPKVYRQWQDKPEVICPPEGEMLVEAEGRVRTALTKLLKRHREGVIGLVVSEPLASLVRQFVVNSELGDLWKATNGHARWEILEAVSAGLAKSG